MSLRYWLSSSASLGTTSTAFPRVSATSSRSCGVVEVVTAVVVEVAVKVVIVVVE